MISLETRKNELYDDLVILFLILYVMFLKWLGLGSYGNLVITVLMAVDFARFAQFEKKRASLICLVLFTLCAGINYLVNPGSVSLFFRNVYPCIRALLMFFYFSRLVVRKPDYVRDTLKRLFVPLNIYILVNIPVLLLQSRGMTRLAARSMAGATSKVVQDYYSGLFGLYGTPCLAIFCVLMFLLNFYYADNFASKSLKKYIKAYNWLLTLFFCYFSVINDNKFYYVEMVAFGIIYYITLHRPDEGLQAITDIKVKKKNRFFVINLVILLGIIAAGFGYAYEFSESFKKTADLFIRKIMQGLDFNRVTGSGERLGIIIYMLNDANRLWGYGAAKIVVEAGTMGYVHFGQADMASFMAYGGISYTLLLILTAGTLVHRPFKRFLVPFMYMCGFIMMAVYTRAFRETSTLTSLLFIFAVIWGVNHPIQKKEEPV